MSIFIHNFTLLSPNICFMVLALLTDALRTMFAKSIFPRSILHRLSSRRMAILIMLALTMAELFKSIRISLTIDMWFLIPKSFWYSLTVTSTWKSVALSRQLNIFTSIFTRIQIMSPFRLKAMMRFMPIFMQDISSLLKHATISLNFLYTWNGLLSIVYLFIYQVTNLWSFMLVRKSIKWLKMSRILNYLDGSRQIKILILLLLGHMILSIRTFQRSLSGIQAVVYGRSINITRPLDTCSNANPNFAVRGFILLCWPCWSYYCKSLLHVFGTALGFGKCVET